MGPVEFQLCCRGVQKGFSSFKGVCKKFCPVVRGRGHKRVLDTQFFHFVAPLPMIIDRPLS